MKRITITSITLLYFAAASVNLAQADKPTQTSILKGRNGQHSFTLRLAKGPFLKEHHKITYPKRPDAATWPMIDGKYEYKTLTFGKDGGVHTAGGKNWYGTDGGLPRNELYTFDVIVDGKRWRVPTSLYNNCYMPNIHLKSRPFVWAWLTKDGKRLTVKMHGGDGAGAYGVLWHLRKSGKHTRKFWSRT